MNITDGIISAIRTKYGSGYKIYTESVEQGLKTPCFFVQCLNPSGERFLQNRYRFNYQYIIQYFPESKHEPYTESLSVAEDLIELLADIQFEESILHSGNVSCNTNDDILTVETNYSLFRYKGIESDKMATHKFTAGVKNGE